MSGKLLRHTNTFSNRLNAISNRITNSHTKCKQHDEGKLERKRKVRKTREMKEKLRTLNMYIYIYILYLLLESINV